MPWPTTTIVTTGMDADTDALPRTQILAMAQNVNSIKDMRAVANGIASLDATSKIPSTQLPAMNYLPLAGGTLTGTVVTHGSTGGVSSGTGLSAKVDIRGAGGASDAAYLQFHRPGAYAVQFGLDADNILKVGGYSMGTVAYTIYHSGNLNLATKANVASPTFTGTVTTTGGRLDIEGPSPTIFLKDTDEGPTRSIHHNSGYIGFLTSVGNWLVGWNDGGGLVPGCAFDLYLNAYYARNDKVFGTEQVYSGTTTQLNLINNWGHGSYIVEFTGIHRWSVHTTGLGTTARLDSVGNFFAASGDIVTLDYANRPMLVWKIKKGG